jgi:hypothetical protein
MELRNMSDTTKITALEEEQLRLASVKMVLMQTRLAALELVHGCEEAEQSGPTAEQVGHIATALAEMLMNAHRALVSMLPKPASE